jgi:RimJ/RimL family protein N-acetyltransferase
MRVCGEAIDLRLAEIEDAAFILAMRTDPRLSRFLSPTPNNLDLQREWLADYKTRERHGIEYYFIIESKERQPCGTVRLYDFRGDSFSWGSWVIRTGSPPWISVESALLVYRCGFEELGFAESHFEVRKDNARVVAFHRRFGAQVVGEDERNYYFRFLKAGFSAVRERYEKMVA